MADCFQTPAHNQLTGIVEQKINNYKLNIFKDDKDYKKLQKSSPLWKDLQSGSSRVKRLSKMFEEKSKTFSRKTNWWLDEKVYKSLDSKSPPPTKTSNFSTPPTRKARNSVGRSLESIDSPSKLSKLDRIVHELLQKEVSYIQALERGIEFYVRVIKEGDGEVPAALRNQAFRLFGNIEEICKLHKSSVYPRLTLLKGNVRLVAELISSFIQNDQFYCYIVYAMNQKSAEQFIAAYNDFFDHLRSKSNDFLGISSFIIQPIQKLPRYKMLLDEMIKELSRDVTAIDKPTVAACCVAEKNVQRLLVRLNEALSINDIIETHEFGASVQLGILTTMQRDFGVDIDEPMMILVPRMSSNFPFRSPFNVYSLGKFIKSSVFRAQELVTGRSFPSKVFLFEKCLMYTKLINNTTLGYRNHFGFNKGFGFYTQESHVSLRVTNNSGKNEVTFSSDNIEAIVEMKKLITQFYEPSDSTFSSVPLAGDYEMFTDDEDDWVLEDAKDANETVHIANSRFYIKSPDPESD